MKHSFILVAAMCSFLASCSSTEQSAQAGALAGLAIDYAERSGRLTPEQAALARRAKEVVLPAVTAQK